jgi:AraC-like DNA-binding protein
MLRIIGTQPLVLCRILCSECEHAQNTTERLNNLQNTDARANRSALSESLLAAHPLIAPGDQDAIADRLLSIYGVRRVDFSDIRPGFAGLANRIELPDLTLHFCRYEGGVDIQFPAMPGYRQPLCLTGTGGISFSGRDIQLSNNRSGIIPPGTAFRANYNGDYAQLVLELNERVVGRKLELLDVDLQNLPLGSALNVRRTPFLRRVALQLANQFNNAAQSSQLAIAELSQALTYAFLAENVALAPVSASSTLSAARLEDYIRAHWAEPLTVEAVAEACDMSVRSVFLRFKQRYGLTPNAFIRQVRLEEAKRLLERDPGSTSVLDVALKCGFSSFGHFARRYREAFGELPSATLARRR